MPAYKTGKFEGRMGDSIFSSTHIVGEDDKPICGAKINPAYELVVVSMGANLDYTTCKSCKRIYKARDGKG